MVIREIMHYCGVSLPSILNWSPEIGAVKAIVEFAEHCGPRNGRQSAILSRRKVSVEALFDTRVYMCNERKRSRVAMAGPAEIHRG
jgi:hypothetical protein